MIRLFFKRIFRAIKHIPWFLYKCITYKYETCKKCGVGYRLMWWVDNKIWEKVFGNSDIPGCYCLTCFVEIAESKGIKIGEEQISIKLFYY